MNYILNLNLLRYILLISTLSLSQVFAQEGCDLPESTDTGYLHVTSTGSVWYKTPSDIAGFEFHIEGATLNSTGAASGGVADFYGFTLITEPETGGKARREEVARKGPRRPPPISPAVSMGRMGEPGA